jgi:hypothetical protein
LLAAVLLGAAAVVFAAYAYGALTETNQTYTGCLGKGLITNVAIGDEPMAPCKKDQTQISWSQTGPPASLADTECIRAAGDTGAVVMRVRGDDTIELSCETESGHQSLPVTKEVAQLAADLLLSGERDLDVAQPNCAVFPAFGCVDGQPVSPTPQLHMNGLDVFVTEVANQNRFDITHAVVLVKTLQPIPIGSLGGNCSLTIDPQSYKPVRGQLQFLNLEDQTGAPNRITVQNLQILEFDAGDFEIGGGILCSAFNKSTLLPAVIALIADSIQQQVKDDLCGAPGPNLFMPCIKP